MLQDILEVEENYSDVDSMSEDLGDDKYDPRAKTKEGGIMYKKQSKMQMMMEHAAIELGKSVPIMTRGPEIELSSIRDVEDLKQTLAQHQINVPNDVLRRAIILPKDQDTSGMRYPEEGEFLPKNPATDPEYQRKKEELERLMMSVKDLKSAKNRKKDGDTEKKSKKKVKKKNTIEASDDPQADVL